jgi:hypothetical protein
MKTEIEKENYIDQHDDIVYQIAERTGYLDGVHNDDLPDKVDDYIANTDKDWLYRAIIAHKANFGS